MFDTVADFNAGWNNGHVVIEGAVRPQIENIRVDFSPDAAITFIGCHEARTRNLFLRNCVGAASSSRLGYGLIEYNSDHSEHYEISGENCRHVYTDGFKGPSAEDVRLGRYGAPLHNKLIGGKALNCTSAAYDTHPGGYFPQFIGLTVESQYQGYGGERRNFQIRSTGALVQNCVAMGGGESFVAMFNSTDTPPVWNDTVFDGCKHIYLQKSPPGPAFMVTGVAGGNRGMRVVDPVIEGRWEPGSHEHSPGSSTNSFNVLFAEVGDMEVINPSIRLNIRTNGASLFRADDGKLTVRGGTLDIRGSSGTGARLCLIADNDAEIVVRNLRLLAAGTSFAQLLDRNGFNGSADVEIVSDVVTGTVTGSGSATLTFAVQMEDGSAAYEITSQAWNSSGNKVVSLAGRRYPTVIVDAVVTSTGVAFNSVSAGAFVGQRLIVNNSPDSTQSLTVNDNAGSLLDLASNATVAVGAGLTLYWTGSVWRRAS